MVELELHINGPAFGLPSIDPQCLAAITFLKSTLPEDSWVLVASSGRGINTSESGSMADHP